ncbi:DUF4179 domain-containing protein [Metabacillus fastidiosus]|uniref:DUF4179 domain-containing protein n=1 Tax=Metabacillus fastidiosus TaxID=1458 RepID=UPI002E200E1C|nr:DUF4179 domain-containing protein [Metabacillus fastidiosus]
MSTEKRKIKELLSQTEIGAIQFSEKDRQSVHKKISKLHKPIQENKKKFKFFTISLLTPIVASVLILLIIMSQSENTREALGNVPIVGSIFSLVGDDGLKLADQEEIVQKINKTAEDQEVKFTIKEVLYDGTRLSIGYSVQSDTKEVAPIDTPKIYINEKEFYDYSYAEYGNDQKDKHYYEGLIEFHIYEPIPDRFSMKVSVQGIGIVRNPEAKRVKDRMKNLINGNWNVTFNVEKAGKSYEYMSSSSAKSEDEKLTVSKITFAPSATKFILEHKYKKQENQSPFDNRLDFQLFNDDGQEIKILTQASTSGSDQNDHHIKEIPVYFSPLKEIPDYVILKPYIMHDGKFPFKEQKYLLKNLKNQLPFEIPQGDGKIIIHEIVEKTSKNQVLINYEVIGDVPEVRVESIYLTKGKSRDMFIESPQYSFKNKRYEKQYETLLTDDLYIHVIGIDPVVRKDLEVKVPIEKDQLLEK